MNSIRVFLVAVILATITLATFLIALRGYQSSMLEADRLFDRQLLESAKLIANTNSATGLTEISHDSDLAFQVWHSGKLVIASSNAPARAISRMSAGFDYGNFNGYRWRTVAYHDIEKQNWVLAAERTDLRFMLAENVILESIFPILVGLPVIALLIWLIVTRGLKPLHELADELGAKQADNLAPLSIRAPKQELEKIVASSNGLLKRLETSLQREKQFASDAAHELRTPISALKIQLHNLRREFPGKNPDLDELTQTAEQLEHIVEQIMDLYRHSPDQYHASFSVIDLTSLAREVVAQEYARFDASNQQLEFTGRPCLVRGYKFALTTLLSNLLSNANKYTPANGSILVDVHPEAGEAVLTIEDSGPGIAADQRQAVFGRFYRVGGDRHNSGAAGCGLGLAIVSRIVELHKARIEITPSRFSSGAAFRIRFAACDEAGAAA